MSDIKDPRLLWAKGLLFLGLAALAGWMIWIKIPDWETILVLAIFAWACSRAYYFAFYVIEKYADPNFRYSGLLSLLGYIKAKLLGQPYIASIAPTESQPVDVASLSFQSTPTRRWRKFYYEALWWSIVILLANLIVPSIYDKWIWSQRWVGRWYEELLLLGLMGLYCAQVGVAAFLCAVFPKPAKWTFPVLIFAVLVCSISLGMGIGLAEESWDVENQTIILIGGAIAGGCVFIGTRIASRIFRVRFDVSRSRQETERASIQEHQISIKYILIATTVVGVLLGIAKTFNLRNLLGSQGDQWMYGLASLAIVLGFGALFLTLLVLLTLARISRWTYFSLAVGLVGLLTLGSCFMPAAFAIVQHICDEEISADAMDIPMAVAFNSGFGLGCYAILLGFRLAGLRLWEERRKNSAG